MSLQVIRAIALRHSLPGQLPSRGVPWRANTTPTAAAVNKEWRCQTSASSSSSSSSLVHRLRHRRSFVDAGIAAAAAASSPQEPSRRRRRRDRDRVRSSEEIVGALDTTQLKLFSLLIAATAADYHHYRAQG